MVTKVCSKCKIEKDITEFSKNRSQPGGYRYWCKKCTNAWLKEYRRNRLSKDPIYRGKLNKYSREYIKKRYSEDPEFEERVISYAKKHSDKIREEKIASGMLKPRGKKQCCIILEKHHELLKDDPEHLPTEFIKALSGCACEKI